MTTAYPPAGAPAPNPLAARQVRYGQLLYTSFDDESGIGGGWQIKDQSGGLTAVERELLTARVVTKFDVDPALPQFPTAEQIAARPARLAYSPTDVGAALWHTVDAGNDATGRPGNVMAHIVLDRDTGAPSRLRPIQLWGSPDWCRPYGAADVLSTELGKQVPAPNPEFTAAAVIHFLAGTAVDRQGTFRVLLDAVYAAMTGGPKVALLTADNTTGPLWIAAVSFFMSPGCARRFSWTTHDRPAQAVTNMRKGTHLVVVPRETATALPVVGEWVVLDELEEPTVRELGSEHIAGAAKITVTAWSTLTEGVLADEAMALQLLGDQDNLAEEVGDHGLSPIWPLAVAVSRRNDLAEFHRDAQHALAEDAPAHVGTVEWLNRLVSDAAVATAPGTLAEARGRLMTAAKRGSGIRYAAMHYLGAALTDPGFGDDELVDIPEVRVLAPADWQPALERAWARTPEPQHESGAQSVRRTLIASELLYRLAGPGLDIDQALRTAVARLSLDQLDALYGSEAATITGLRGISAATLETVLRPALAAAVDQRDPRKLPLSVWQWAFHDGDTPFEQQGAPPPNPGAADRGLYPWYVHALTSSASADRLPASWRREIAGHAIFMALDTDSLSDPRCRHLVTTLAGSADLDVADLADIFTRWPQRVSPGAAISAVLYRDCPAELLAVLAARHVDPDSADISGRCAVAAARLRRLALDRPGTADAYLDAATDAAPTLVSHLTAGHLGEVVQDIADVLIAAYLTGRATRQDWVQSVTAVTDALQQRIDSCGGSTAGVVADFVGAGALQADWIAGEAFLSRFGELFDTPLIGKPAKRSRDNAFGDEVIALLIKRRSYDGPRDAGTLRDTVWPRIRQLSATHAEEFFGRYAKIAREWLHDQRL